MKVLIENSKRFCCWKHRWESDVIWDFRWWFWNSGLYFFEVGFWWHLSDWFISQIDHKSFGGIFLFGIRRVNNHRSHRIADWALLIVSMGPSSYLSSNITVSDVISNIMWIHCMDQSTSKIVILSWWVLPKARSFNRIFCIVSKSSFGHLLFIRCDFYQVLSGWPFGHSSEISFRIRRLSLNLSLRCMRTHIVVSYNGQLFLIEFSIVASCRFQMAYSSSRIVISGTFNCKRSKRLSCFVCIFLWLRTKLTHKIHIYDILINLRLLNCA